MAPPFSPTIDGPRPVGEAVIVQGQVRARAADGTERLLRPGSPVFADERIVTGSDGMVSIVFADSDHSQLDLGRLSDVLVDRGLFGDALPADGGGAAAEVSALHQALQEGDFDPSLDAEPPAAGGEAAGAGGGGHPYVVFEASGTEVIPDSGPGVPPVTPAETSGVQPDFLAPPSVDILPMGPEAGAAGPALAAQQTAGADAGGNGAADGGGGDLSRAVADTASLVEVRPAAVQGIGEGGHTVSGNLLANDTPGEGSLAVTAIEVDGIRFTVPASGGLLLTTGLGGELTVHSNGDWSYTIHSAIRHEAAGQGDGRPDYEVFTYTVTDSSGDLASSTLTVDILDTAPEAHPDTNLTMEGSGAVTGNVIFGWDDATYVAGSSDTESADAGLSLVDVRGDLADTFTLDTALTTVHGGTVIFHGNGSYVYTPPAVVDNSRDADGSGQPVQEHFVYTVEDGDGSPASAGLTIDILDTAPVAENDRASVTEGDADGDGINNQVSGNLILADHNGSWATGAEVHDQADRTGADGDVHLVHVEGDFAPGVDFVAGSTLATAQGGSIVVHADGSYTYTAPDHILHETDGGGDGIPDNEQFVYTIEDGDGSQASAVLTVAIRDAGASGDPGSGRSGTGAPVAVPGASPGAAGGDTAADAAPGQEGEPGSAESQANATAANTTHDAPVSPAGDSADDLGGPVAAEPANATAGELLADTGTDAFADGADPDDPSIEHLVPPPDPTA